MPDEVAPNVFLQRGTDVNWYLVQDGDALTLIDCGYPGDAEAVEQSIRALGRRPEDVRAVLITHAHVDHIGATRRLYDRYRVPTWTGAQEARHARREYLEQAGPLDVARNIWRPGVLPWALRVTRQGAARPYVVPHAEPFRNDGALDLPGHPLPVPTPGHTSGHTAYLLPAAGAVVTGDGLVTGHPMLRGAGPQLLPSMFNHGDVYAGLAGLEDLDADLVLPGHGQPLHRPIRDAIREARERAA
jgi:glyoxylase-like metal-dependent hydrolase (beta-lactamase superfamily II)